MRAHVTPNEPPRLWTHGAELNPQPWTPGEIQRATAGTLARVDSYVYVGGYLAAADPKTIRQHGITNIAKMFADDRSYPGGAARIPGVTYFVAATEDRPDYDIRKDLMRAYRFVKRCVDNGQKVLVHCHAGISRSVTVVLLYLMLSKGHTLDTAMPTLRLVRPVMRPNAGFMRMLRETDATLKRIRRPAQLPIINPDQAMRPPLIVEDIMSSREF